MTRAILDCATAIINIRATLQRYKDGKPPETKYYYVSSHDLLEMLNATMIAWCGLEWIQDDISDLTSALIDSVKKEGKR